MRNLQIFGTISKLTTITFSRVNLSPSPQATTHQQSLNNGQKFYYQLQSSLSALSGANSTNITGSSSTNDSNAPKSSINAIGLNNKSTSDYVHNSE